MLAAATVFCLILTLSLPSEEVSAKRHEEKITVNFKQVDDDSSLPQAKTEKEPAPALDQQEETIEPPAPELTWKKQTVKSGDNLSTLFQRVSLGAGDVHRLMSSTPLAKPLIDMRPGQELQFGLNAQGKLVQLKYVKTKLESYLYTSTTDEQSSGFTGEHLLLQPDIMMAYREASIEDSLFLAGERAQLPHGLIMELANIFGWDVDFALDIRKGDHFSLIYEEKFLQGEKIGNGNILAAEFTNQGKTFKAVRYEDGNGNANYYTPEGFSMRKAFLRAPLDFTRISSGFNLRRKHPIHKKIRAHRGVDYAAPRGTPIFAAGDGKVIASSYSKANGNYVFIQHGQRFTTKYLHLQKRKVKKGQSVKQRQVIGTLGSTGYATGPHLHYEFLVNGVHRNPRTVQLPQAQPVNQQERARFVQNTEPLMAQLANYQQNTQLALASPDNTTSNN
jgi:murein DD-endopeptidase MepM/ murein hydrolase activator NlpD